MTALRYAAFLGLAVWMGGLIVLGGFSAPALFDILPAQLPDDGRQLAGAVFGVMLARFQYVAWSAAAVIIGSLALRAALGPRPRRTALRIWTVIGMVAMGLVTSFVIIPHIDAIRAGIDGAVAALPAADARRVELARWHSLASGLMLLTLAAGLGLAWAEVRDQN